MWKIILDTFGLWEILLMLSVTSLASIVAYIHNPRYKAMLLLFPFPFTCAFISLGEPINATHMMGAFGMYAYWFTVYTAHKKFHLPIILSIGVGVLVYCGAALALAHSVPRTDSAFIIATCSIVIVVIILHIFLPYKVEGGHKTPLPVWMKIPILLAIVVGLVFGKSLLSGFMTAFPMVGLLTAYETRYSLWTSHRQVPVVILGLVTMEIAIFITQDHLHIFASLACGWTAMATVVLILQPLHWRRAAVHERRVQLEEHA
ncbi:MAG: hypothetical protein HRU15_16285 [Planctomycetes bacterium]|nr:hypothetical protein [Planctomycetota bacterium]